MSRVLHGSRLSKTVGVGDYLSTLAQLHAALRINHVQCTKVRPYKEVPLRCRERQGDCRTG